ncbi:hypothetical protein evm_002186 [Chilo suppressalis]|nr:hypothetical protein evm_002186 [Chilo suppressalis]
MGDRNDPIKFGPEWLRNLAREGNASTSGNNNQSAVSPNSSNSGATGSPSGGNTASGSSPANTSTTPQNVSPKVKLAKLRYGREEMLALYDRNSDAPPELKYVDILYQPRGKAPLALNNTFEDDIQRENMRSGPPIGGNNQGERFGLSRGIGRGLSVSDGRGRPRIPFVRSPSAGRGATTWHLGSPRMPGYSGGTDDDSPMNNRSSWSGGNTGNPVNRNSGEQAEWTPSKLFRSKRQGQATNWRQSREEGEEWRSSDAGRRSNQQDKWDRDWGERQTQDKPQTWSSNRRTWVGGDTQNNDDNLPEWAVDNAEACGGTFDSSGAFHGFSNDDTNIPKTPDNTYPLARSHTHGSFARSKTAEEGSEEWWASDKAKKLSPKRFDASDVKFKKQMSTPESCTGTDAKPSTTKDDDGMHEISEQLDNDISLSDRSENTTGDFTDNDKYSSKSSYKSKYLTESKTFDSHMRSDINLDEANEGQERGNFQSVMITPNNSLRQKHQNIVSAASDVSRDTYVKNQDQQAIMQLLQNATTSQTLENEMRKQASEDKIVDEIFDMTLEDKDLMPKQKIISTLKQPSASDMSSNMVNSMPQMQNMPMQMRLSSPVYPNQGMMINTKSNIPNSGMQSGLQALSTGGLQGVLPSGMQLPMGLQMGLPQTLQQVTSMQALGMPVNMHQGSGNQQQGSSMQGSSMPGNMQTSSLQNPGIESSGLQGSMQPSMQSVGITNSALNASLGLPIRPVSNSMGLPMQGLPPPVRPSSGMNSSMGGSGMQGLGPGNMQGGSTGMSGYPASSLLGMSNPNIANSSLFIGQNSSNPSMGTSGDIPMPSNHGNQSNMYPMHGQHSGSQAAFSSSIYSNIMQQSPNQQPPNTPTLADQWYYEDPEKNIQGPFTSKEMYKWYRAGFFSPSFMVRRACDTHMRPLGSYGPVVPFTPMLGYDRSPGPHESMLSAQQGIGLDSVMNMPKLNEAPTMDSMQFGSVGLIRNPPFPQQQPMVDSLWSQPSASSDLMWVQQAMSGRNDSRVNNLPMFFWDQQPSTMASNALIPEDITKEMKTEDQILAQLRASQNISTPQGVSFTNEQPAVSQPPSKSEETYTSTTSATPNLEELQKLIQKDTLAAKHADESISDNIEVQPVSEKTTKSERTVETKASQVKPVSEPKQTKQSKNDNDKATKNKENSTKSKNKKKEEKKDELESKTKEDNVKSEKTSEEASPTKSKKEDKLNKKELEKEKKEWLKEGFTIVKGSEKNASKDNKKKVEENKVAEESERRRKEEEKLALEEEKKRKQAETTRNKELQQQQQQQRQAIESVAKKAPWSAVANQAMLATNKDGLTLAEIQRLEREKKLEQMKEQQQMMQIIAQQQAAALAREQAIEVAKKGPKPAVANQAMLATNKDRLTLADIQRLEREKKLELVEGAATNDADRRAAATSRPCNGTGVFSCSNSQSFEIRVLILNDTEDSEVRSEFVLTE